MLKYEPIFTLYSLTLILQSYLRHGIGFILMREDKLPRMYVPHATIFYIHIDTWHRHKIPKLNKICIVIMYRANCTNCTFLCWPGFITSIYPTYSRLHSIQLHMHNCHQNSSFPFLAHNPFLENGHTNIQYVCPLIRYLISLCQHLKEDYAAHRYGWV